MIVSGWHSLAERANSLANRHRHSQPDRAIMFAGVATMSQYAYHCEDCDKEFTQQHHISDVEKAEVVCPHCGSKRVHQLVSAFSAVTAKKS